MNKIEPTDINILVVGNGFDLKHKLPTGYINFLEIINILRNTKQYDEFKDKLEKYFKKNKFSKDKNLEAFDYSGVIDSFKDKKFANNSLEKYLFNQLKKQKGKVKKQYRWIDFEEELETIIKTVKYIFDNIENLEERETRKFSRAINIMKDLNLRQHIKYNLDECEEELLYKKVFKDLDDLINVLKWYFLNVIDGLINVTSLKEKDFMKLNYCISFNYTQTLLKLYGNIIDSEKYYFIHGKYENMVLGYEHQDEDLNTRKFTKSFQRIVKNTDFDYFSKIVDDINKLELSQVDILDIDERGQAIYGRSINIYFWGHSFGVTDKEKIKELFYIQENLVKDNYVKVTIFYHNEDSKYSILNNLFEILGSNYVEEHIANKRILFEQKK